MKLLRVEWNDRESCTYYVDLNRFSKAHDHSDHVSLDSFSGTYRFDKLTKEVTLDTGTEIRKANCSDWFLYVE